MVHEFRFWVCGRGSEVLDRFGVLELKEVVLVRRVASNGSEVVSRLD